MDGADLSAGQGGNMSTNLGARTLFQNPVSGLPHNRRLISSPGPSKEIIRTRSVVSTSFEMGRVGNRNASDTSPATLNDVQVLKAFSYY